MSGDPSTSPQFKDNAHEALADAQLQRALRDVAAGLHRPARRAVAAKLPEFEALRDSARDIKDHTLAHLDLYLEAYESKVTRGRRRRCITRATPRRRATIILDICRKARRQDASPRASR